jgi:hypothetical protein
VLTRGAAQRCRLLAAKAYRLLCAVRTTAVEEDKILPHNPCRVRARSTHLCLS